MDVACMNNWGYDGGKAEIDVVMTVTELFLPKNGEIVIADDAELFFELAEEVCEDESDSCDANVCSMPNFAQACALTCRVCTPRAEPDNVEWK